MSRYEVVIGLETHIELNTLTKIFCTCKASSWGDAPNTNICPVCAGLPGVLPVLNREAVFKGARLAAAMHAAINPKSAFDRKNYFYPDLPKGYQITQFFEPIGKGGHMDLEMPDGSKRHVRIHRLHLEEDAGKTKLEAGLRLLDYNRCGVPLIEMVTEPDLRSADEAAQYLTQLRQLLRWIGVSEADMEKGHLRCDANVSLRPIGSQTLGTKTEIKNVNSIDSVRQAINMEVKRQTEELEAGRRIESYTLDWDADTGKLRKMRSKETEADYRYFGEPDLLPVILSQTEIEDILNALPEMPLERKHRFVDVYHLTDYDAGILTGDRALSDYFEETVKAYGGEAKTVSNWVMNELLRMLNNQAKDVSSLKLRPDALAEIIHLVDQGKVNAATGKTLLEKVEASGKRPLEIVEKESLGLVNDDGLLLAKIQELLAEAPAEVAAFKAGKESLLGWFVGQVMRKMGGKADPKRSREILLELLGK
ncbi:MAG: Asp-tRNA(Asn)/Glu-tRNA(Gln) amidotransferase subunit GatB [Anaerolineaceae bacterium]|nr:Asp-tRNA(Asn)/Glu-tRNA(Gln) amidotransferase subunit GatB [Anaerolineaceae bacterium]